MKALHVVMSGHLGGGQRVALQIASHLLKKGDQVCFLSPNRGAFTDQLSQHGIAVFNRPLRKTFHLHDALAVTRLIRREKIDLVHTHSLGAGNILSRLGGLLGRTPVISHVHAENNWSQNRIVQQYQQILERLTLNSCQRVIAVSRRTRERLILEGARPEKVEVITNGIEIPAEIPTARESVLAEFSLPPTTRILTCVAQLCETKGQEILIRAAAEVSRANPGFVIFLIGEDLQYGGAYREKLEALTRELHVEANIRFTGFRPDPNRFLQASLFAILPSFAEGFPVSLLEAMASSRAVVATNVGGIPELVANGETGILIEPADATSLSAAILDLLKNPERTNAMGAAGRARVEKEFRLSGMLDKVMQIYHEALQT